jgi:hypothetical protein
MDAQETTTTLGDVVRPFVTALIFVSCNETGGYLVLNNGTGAFVDTGKVKLLVTNAHVVQAFDQKLRTDPSLKLMIGGQGKTLTIDRSWLKDHYSKPDLKLDLATFILPEHVDISVCGKTFYKPESWPPARVSAGDLVSHDLFSARRLRDCN